MIIKCLLVLGQPSIAGLLERDYAPLLKWVCSITPNPVVIWQKGFMLLIETS